MDAKPQAPMAIPNSITQAVADWRSAVQRTLRTRFASTLEKAIDALMDQAEKARNNHVQATFFQGQQEIRRHCDTIQQRFADALTRQMNAAPSAADDPEQPPASELKLINPDAFERQVVLQAISDRAEQQYYEVLHELGHRLSVLHRGAAVQPADIPASPAQLLTSFDDATSRLNIEHIAWQALAIVFDHGVVRHLQQDLEALNDALRQAGVLPNMKFQVATQPAAAEPKQQDKPATPAATKAATKEPATGQDSANPDLSRIRSLLPGSQASRADGGARLDAAQITELFQQSHHKLVELLPDHGLFTTGTSSLRISTEQLSDSQQAMRRQRQAIKREIGQERLSRYDESTIDIIGALFDAMLDDADLPAAMKALFSHLHTPYLKLAMREPELLSNTDHPARQLLDEMVNAGENWGNVADLGKSIFPTLKDILETLRDSDTPDRNQLEQQRALLASKVGELSKHREVRSNRTTEAEVGKAKLDQAKEVADDLIHQLLDAQQPCKPCQDFLTGPWHDYLTLLLLRNNGRPGGDGWQTSQALGEELASMSRAVTGPQPPSRESLAEMRRHLTDALGELTPHYLPQIDSLMQAMRALSEQDRSQIPKQDSAPKPTPRPHTAKPDSLDPPLNAAEQALLGELRDVAPGTAFRLPAAGDQPPRLLTVTWFNPKTDRLLFVDQNGAKADLISVSKLARMIHQKQAQRVKPKDKPSFVSRALQALRQYLEKNSMLKQGASRA